MHLNCPITVDMFPLPTKKSVLKGPVLLEVFAAFNHFDSNPDEELEDDIKYPEGLVAIGF